MNRFTATGFICGILLIVYLLCAGMDIYHSSGEKAKNENNVRGTYYSYVVKYYKEMEEDYWAKLVTHLSPYNGHISYIIQDADDYGRIKYFDINEDIIDDLADPIITSLFRKNFVESIEFNKNGSIIFTLGGGGNVIYSYEYGFYYSPHNIPILIGLDDYSFNIDEIELLYNSNIAEYSDEWYIDSKTTTSNIPADFQYYSKRIKDRWFYYESGH